MATGAAIIAGLSLIAGTTQGIVNYNQQKHAKEDQERQIAEAEQKQAEADANAEKKRLEALAAQQAGDTGRRNKFDFGIDSATSKQTTTIQPTETGILEEDDENYNPFYARGML